MILEYKKYDWLNKHFSSKPNNVFICTETTKYTFYQTREKVDSIKKNIASSEILNKNIGVIATLTPEFFFTILALWELGANPILIPSQYKEDEIIELINSANISFILSFDKNIKNNKQSLYPFDHFQFIDNTLQNITENFALMILSSGTSSKPKIVCHNFDSLYNSFLISDSFIKHTENDKWIMSLSAAHIGGFSIFLRSLIAGCQLIIPNSLKFVNVLSSIKMFNPNLISFTPSSLEYIQQHITFFSNFKYIFIGGAASNNNILSQLINLKIPLVKVYGSSETAAMISAVSLLENKDKVESSGKPLLNVKISIVENDEIFINSPSLLKKYLNEKHINFSSSFYTNDIGYIDKDGFLFVKGRKDDIIISGGLKINPNEVRNVLLNFEEIKDAFVFSVPDIKWGEKVCVALIAHKYIHSNEIKCKLKNIIADYKIPKEIIMIDKFPLNHNGKIDKIKLISLLESKTQ